MPGLLFWVLSISAQEVADYVRNTAKRVPSLGAFSPEVLLETNPLANWADQNLYYDLNIETKIGDATCDASFCLYANYSQWAKANGQGTMTTQRFSSNLLNLLKTQLGIDATKRKTNKGRFITCIGIRQPGNLFPLLISENGDDLKAKNNNVVTSLVIAESLTSDDIHPSDDHLVNSVGNQAPTNTTCKHNQEMIEGENSRHVGSTSSPAMVSGSTQHVIEFAPNQSQVVTHQPETHTEVKSKIAETLAGEDTQSISQQIIANWNDLQALGKIILAIADTEELKKEVQNYTTKQLNHIKNAANQAWKPGCSSRGEYCGEKVELWDFGSKRDWKVRTANGSIIRASRGNIYPWLGI